MEGETQTSAVETQIGQEEKQAETKDVLTKEQAEAFFKQKEEAMRREFQSKFDTILTEKKKEVEKSLTLEEQVKLFHEQLAERDAVIARKEAGVNLPKENEFYEGVKMYLSSDVQNITKGAELLGGFFEKMKAGYEAEKAKAVQDALVQAGIQKKPITGSTTNTLTLAEFNKLAPKEQADYMAKVGKLQE